MVRISDKLVTTTRTAVPIRGVNELVAVSAVTFGGESWGNSLTDTDTVCGTRQTAQDVTVYR